MENKDWREDEPVAPPEIKPDLWRNGYDQGYKEGKRDGEQSIPQEPQTYTEKCEHKVVSKYCFNCRFKNWKTLNVEMFGQHHYVRLKGLERLLKESIAQAIAEDRERVRGIIQKERDTWAKESIGDKALQSLEKALQEKNIYFCEKCKKQSICDKPTVYKNCPCGADFSSLDKPLTDKE